MIAKVRQISENLEEYRKTSGSQCAAGQTQQLEKLETYLKMYCMRKNITKERLYPKKPDAKKENEGNKGRGWLKKAAGFSLLGMAAGALCLHYGMPRLPESLAMPKQQAIIYTVKKGDTLEKISQTHYGSRAYATEIYRHNKERDKFFPITIYEKQKIYVPVK
jgi:hypothetical protein